MELRHLRYFLAVGEASNFTKAAAQLRVAQPALSRQVRDLEEEIGVELLRRSPRGVRLTAEGRLFLQEVRELLNRTGESVEKVRALVRGEYSELRWLRANFGGGDIAARARSVSQIRADHEGIAV
jgi:DNA-binding transcriptional LysR family regulator